MSNIINESVRLPESLQAERTIIPIPQGLKERVVDGFIAQAREVAGFTGDKNTEHVFVSGIHVNNTQQADRVVVSTIRKGERNFSILAIPLDEVRKNGAIPIIQAHSHRQDVSPLHSTQDIETWKYSIIGEPIEFPDGRPSVRSIGKRPFSIVIRPQGDDPDQADLTILVQDDGKSIFFDSDALWRTMNAGETERMLKLGFRMARFKLNQRNEIKLFLLNYGPHEFVTELIVNSR